MYFLLGALLLLLRQFQYANSIPIDNGVVGDPTIQCSSDALTVLFVTQKPFEGRVYAKGFVDQPACVGPGKGTTNPSINLTFTSCGVQRIRQITPPGISVSTTIVISFHKTFVTKVDKAYRVSCFYMEAGKTVTAELDVSMLSTGYVTNQLAMPICKYEILTGSATGAPLKYAKVGDMVYHKWSCESTEPMFCMRVHSCSVDDGQGGKPFQVLDIKGCAVDRYVLQNLEYPADLMAGREAHVFKFADKPALYFNCQLEISIKPSDSQNCNTARPQCPDAGTGAGAAAGINVPSASGAVNQPTPASQGPTIAGATTPTTATAATTATSAAEGHKNETRLKREAKKAKHHFGNESDFFTVVGDFDLPRQQLLVLDIEETQSDSNELGSSRSSNEESLRILNSDEGATLTDQRVCMSPAVLSGALIGFFVVVVIVVLFSVKAFLLRKAPMKYPKYNR